MSETTDMTKSRGHLHPITAMIRDIVAIFGELGFAVGDGPEIESERFNFDALNVPAHHPSRDMQDTFWLKPKAAGKLLRTHTTSVTARELAAFKGEPIRKIFPGKVFRNEATDATHEAQFYQFDAVYVDRDVSLAHLKGTLEYFFKKLLGDDIELRFRPSFFPFTEPSIEIDLKFKGKWLEVAGGGMLSPAVMRSAGIDRTEWRGFAFGIGIDRLVMMKHGIDDVRLLYDADLRLVNQF